MPCRSSMTRRWTSSPAPSAKTSLPFLRKINRSPAAYCRGFLMASAPVHIFCRENPFFLPGCTSCCCSRAARVPAGAGKAFALLQDTLPPRIPSAPPCASVIQKGLPLSGQALARSCAGLVPSRRDGRYRNRRSRGCPWRQVNRGCGRQKAAARSAGT